MWIMDVDFFKAFPEMFDDIMPYTQLHYMPGLCNVRQSPSLWTQDPVKHDPLPDSPEDTREDL